MRAGLDSRFVFGCDLADDHQLHREGMFLGKCFRQLDGILEPHIISAAETALHHQQAAAVGGKRTRSVGPIFGQIHAVVDHRTRRRDLSIPVIPPAMREFALIQNMRGDPGTDQRQNKIAIFGAHEMTKAGIAFAMDPVEAIEALDDPQAAPTRPPQRKQVAGARDHQNGIGRIMRVVCHAARRVLLARLRIYVEGCHAADAIDGGTMQIRGMRKL